MDSIEELADRTRRTGERYHEFLRTPSMSAGVYVLPRGALDGQSPHAQDEVYHVVRGRARFTHRDSDHAVGPGDVLFVPAHDVHRFHSIEEELVVLVVFAPAETPPVPS
ncbi:MAG: cupin domain-containing protein [Thermoplasmata archaeon]|jgi:mannose-6-phosphate isomerase-like protein (cupin superfamily)